MSTKFKLMLAGFLALAVSLAASATAVLAQGEEPPVERDGPGALWGGGRVTAVGDGEFTVQTRRDESRVIKVTSSTQYFTGAGEPAGFADIQVDDRVVGAVARLPDGQAEARLIIIFGPRTQYRGLGVASGVDDAEQSFHFTPRRGRQWEFYVDAGTQLTNRAGEPLTFADIDDGDRLFVHAELRADGQWWAIAIKAGR